MKPAPFEYYAPTHLEEVFELLGEYGSDVKLLAGGQSLIPAMNFRMARPTVIVDLNRVRGLDYIEPLADTGPSMGAVTRQATIERSAAVCIGAMTRQATVERSPEVRDRLPLVHAAMPYVAHPQIRNRGTIGGSLAHADPAAELPAVVVALDATMRVRGPNRVREVPAADFFQGLFTTALAPDELLVEIEILAAKRPGPADDGSGRVGDGPGRVGDGSEVVGHGFHEVARRHGDFALVGAAAVIALDDDGRCSRARLVYVNVGDRPVEPGVAADLLTGDVPTAARIEEAARAAAAALEPRSDIHASAAFRRHLAGVLGRRALTDAVDRAASPPPDKEPA